MPIRKFKHYSQQMLFKVLPEMVDKIEMYL
ncbi:Uncharacterised protein [Providencia heimbachae]|nr:Uncharacterised protein [Providencia heimbachae]